MNILAILSNLSLSVLQCTSFQITIRDATFQNWKITAFLGSQALFFYFIFFLVIWRYGYLCLVTYYQLEFQDSYICLVGKAYPPYLVSHSNFKDLISLYSKMFSNLAILGTFSTFYYSWNELIQNIHLGFFGRSFMFNCFW